jgi:hypothetical protein
VQQTSSAGPEGDAWYLTGPEEVTKKKKLAPGLTAPGPARRNVRQRSLSIPILPVAVGTVLGLTIAVLLVVNYVSTPRAAQPTPIAAQPVAGVGCDPGEQIATHYHAHLSIFDGTTPVPVTAQTGITQSCFYWLHTHDETGIIHIEAPQNQAKTNFTLGQFFRIWNQPLTSNQVATIPIGASQQLKVWVDGKPYSENPSQIVLRSHELIALQIATGNQPPPPAYVWTANDPPQ